MAYPVIRSTSRVNGSSTSRSFSLPVGHQEGDLLLFFFTTDGNPSGVTLSGWTLEMSASNGLMSTRLFTRTRAASEPSSYTISWSGTERYIGTTFAIEADTYDPNSAVVVSPRSFGYGSRNIFSNDVDVTSEWGGAREHLRLLVYSWDDGRTSLAGYYGYGDDVQVTTYRDSISTGVGQSIWKREIDTASMGLTSGFTTAIYNLNISEYVIGYNIAISGPVAAASGPDLAVNIGGAWKTASQVSVNIGGVWKTASNVYVNIGGVWKESTAQAKEWVYITFSSSAPSGSDIYDTMSGSGINDALAFLDANYPASGQSIGTVASIEGNDGVYVTCEVQGV